MEATPEEATEQEEVAEATSPGMLRRVMVIVVPLLGLTGGALLGMSALGPAVGPILAARALGGGSDDGHGSEGAESLIHIIDNLVVNPARSGGTRFVLTTIAVETETAAAAERVATHDVELRDGLIVVLGAMTTDELADITTRPELIVALKRAMDGILGPGIVSRVYLPQFVIQ